MSNQSDFDRYEAHLVELLQEGGIELPPPGGERLWSQLNNAHKAAGLVELPFRQRQAEFFAGVKYSHIPESSDLVSDVIDVIPVSINENYRSFSLPPGVNCLSNKRTLRPPLRFYRLDNVDVLFGEHSFSIVNGSGKFDPVSSRIPTLEDCRTPAIGTVRNAVITMDRFGANNISHHLFDTVGRYVGFNSSPFAGNNGLKDNAILMLPVISGEHQNYVLQKLRIPHLKMAAGIKVHVDHLFVCDQVTIDFNESYSHPALFGEASIVEAMRRTLQGDQAGTDQKIYISRRDSDRRAIVNEAAVEDYLISKGFKIVVPSTLKPEVQLSTLAGARIVVAPHGAGLTNMIACGKGAAVHEFIHPLKGTDAYAILATSLGLSYSFSPLIDHGNGFKGAVDLEKLEAWLLGVA